MLQQNAFVSGTGFNEPQMLRWFRKTYPSYNLQPLLLKRYRELEEARAFNNWLGERRQAQEGQRHLDDVSRLTEAVHRQVPQLRYARAERRGVERAAGGCHGNCLSRTKVRILRLDRALLMRHTRMQTCTWPRRRMFVWLPRTQWTHVRLDRALLMSHKNATLRLTKKRALASTKQLSINRMLLYLFS